MLTDEERKQYERDCQEQEDAGFQKGAALLVSGKYDDLLAALEKEAIDNIREANFEIGVLLGCKETFKTQYVKDMSNYFISLAKYKVEENFDDITRWRSYKK